MTGKRNATKRMAAPPVTAASLEASGIFYLSRYQASAARVRRVLMNRVRRSAMLHGTDPAEGQAAIETLIKRWIELKMINDRAFAEMQVRRLARRGAARQKIAAKLQESGIERELARESLSETRDLAAAAIAVRRRRLGPYRSEETRAEWREKDLAKMGRLGFDRDTAIRVLQAADIETLEALVAEN